MKQLDANEMAAAQKDLQLGGHAKSLANSPAFTEAMAKLKQKYVSEWQLSSDPTVHAVCWAKQRALEDIDTELRALIGSGEMAANTLNRLERR